MVILTTPDQTEAHQNKGEENSLNNGSLGPTSHGDFPVVRISDFLKKSYYSRSSLTGLTNQNLLFIDKIGLTSWDGFTTKHWTFSFGMVTWRGFFKFWTCTLVNSFGIDNDINITPFPTFWKSLYQHPTVPMKQVNTNKNRTPARKFGTLCWNFLLSWSANKHFEHTQSKNYLVVPICLKNMLVKLKHLFLTSGNDKSKHVSKPPSQLIVEKTADFRNWLWYNHPTLKHNMVVIKMEHHQISMDMNGLVEVIESQELGRQRMTLPTTTERHSPANSCVVDKLISWTFWDWSFFIKSWNLIISPTWKLDLTTSTTGLGASRSTVTTCFSSSFSTLPALLMLVERRAATWAANQVFLCCFDKMKDSSYVKITTTDWKTGTMKATNKSPQKFATTHTYICSV